MHALLVRQLRKAGLSEVPLAEGVVRLLQAVSDVYAAADKDRQQLERSIGIASEELFARNRQLEADLEARKRLESDLVEATRRATAAADAAAAANSAKSDFLANMSHEIRTPMNGVVGMAALLLETGLDPTQRDYAQTIKDSGDALLTIINDILDFSKIEARKVSLERISFSLRAAVEEVGMIIAVPAHAKGLDITVDIDRRCPERVVGDPGRFRQILLNLCGNAVKFTARGEVAIELRLETQETDAIGVRCEVRDTGIGIPAHQIAALFSPFAQVDASTTRLFGGTGLGLSIVSQLARMMGGDAGAISAPGQGSTFWFSCRFETSVQPPDSQRVPVSMGVEQRVLIVDDNPATRRVLEGQLASLGVATESADCATAALRALEAGARLQTPFAAALIEHRLAGCDGLRLSRLIRDTSPVQATRLILLTSSGQRTDSSELGEIGFAGFLAKPVPLHKLRHCLALALGSASASSGPERAAVPVADARRLPLTGRRILLAEDNVVNQKVAVRMLDLLGCLVTVVGDGQAAVERWREAAYDLVLMDCQMPVLDGYAATRLIRSLENGARIPIVALTADAIQGTEERCLAAGMDAYLTKPVAKTAIEAALCRFLSGAAR